MALLFHTVHTLPILNFQPADPTCGQAMCGVELVAPTPLVAALTERLLGLRCQVMQHTSSGLGSTKIHPQVDEVQAGLRLQDLSSASQNHSSQNPLAQKHLGVMFFSLPQCRSLSSLISLTNAAPTLRHWLTTLPGRRLFPGPVGICHLEGCDATNLGWVEQVTAMFGPMIR